MSEVLIQVSPIEHKTSAQLKHVRQLISSANLRGLTCDRISSLYRLEGELADPEVQKISKLLLSDPVAEIYWVNSAPQDTTTFYADVWYKPGVTDTVGESIVKAVRDLRIQALRKAFSGTRYEFRVISETAMDAAQSIETFVKHELLNGLVQECKIRKH